MRTLALLAVFGLLGANLHAANIETSLGIGASVPDSENVESSVIGKVDTGFNIGKYLTLGVSASQTGGFKQTEIPSQVKYANASPQAFGTKKFHKGGDIIIVEGDDITNVVNITEAPDKLPSRPTDTTERSYWTAEPFLRVGVPISFHIFPMSYDHVAEVSVKPYFLASLGASGVRSWDGEQRIGTTKGIGGGIAFKVLSFQLALESVRRHTLTNADSYGFWEHTIKAVFSF